MTTGKIARSDVPDTAAPPARREHAAPRDKLLSDVRALSIPNERPDYDTWTYGYRPFSRMFGSGN